MKITCFLLLTLLCGTVCAQDTFDFTKFNLYDLNSMSVGSDTGRINDNSPNRIFVPGRKFTYNYSLKKNGRNYRFAVVRGDGVKSLVDWAWIPLDSVVDGKTFPIETVDLHVFRNKRKFFSLPPEYVEIRYEFINGGRRIFHGEVSSVAEGSRGVYLRPLRSYGFVFTEFNPFPLIGSSLETGKNWTRIVTLPSALYQKAKLENQPSSEFFNLNVEYKVSGDANVFTKLGTIPCKKIEAVGETLQGSKFATFYFNEQWGFVKTEYKNIDGSELVFQLIGVKDLE